MITFAGGSDDIVTVTTPEGVEEYYTYERTQIMWHADIADPDGRHVVAVAALLGEPGWAFAVGQADEDVPLPAWPITIRQDPETSYSVLLEIDAPAGSKVCNIWPESEGE